MRGRHTSAILKMLGIEATIAGSKDEYIQIAIRLGQDRNYRRSIARQIAQNKSKLYNDLSPVRALEDFLFEVLNKPRKLAEPLVNEAFQAGIQHQKVNNLSAARQHFLQVIAAQPHHVDTLYRLGTIAQQSESASRSRILSQCCGKKLNLLFNLGLVWQTYVKAEGNIKWRKRLIDRL